MGLDDRCRRYFVAGLLVWIPLGITLWVLKLLVDFMDQSLLLLPARYQTEALLRLPRARPGHHPHARDRARRPARSPPTSSAASSSRSATRCSARIPIVRSIYGGVKQISDTLFSPEGKAFRRAVLVRYPHAGAWTVALVTGTPEHEVADHPGPRPDLGLRADHAQHHRGLLPHRAALGDASSST